jgi:class 3 adenylate cyclase
MGDGDGDHLLLDARAAADRSDWQAAFDAFHEADARSPLSVDDLERAALAAMWLFDSDSHIDLLQRAFGLHIAADDPHRAVPVALELCMQNGGRGRMAVALGWAERAERLAEGLGPCAQLGQVVALRAIIALDVRHENEEALALYEEALNLGRQFKDADLTAHALVGSGTALVRLGRVAEGMRRVDEAMIDAVSGLLSSVMTARVYCGTISLCQALGDIRRAFEWTQEASSCATRPGMGDYPGDCQMHRAEIMRLRGDWAGAESQLREVMQALGTWSVGHVGQAWYELGEIARRRGDLEAAEDAYRHAEQNEKQPQPGLAMLHLAQGDDALAAAQVRAALAQTADTDPMAIAELLPDAVEIALACGEIDQADAAANRLAGLAAVYDTVLLQARAATSRARVALARRDSSAAINACRAAISLWRDAGAPYEAAQTQSLLAQAAMLAGDREVASVELDAARAVFEGLGARLDLDAARRLHDRIGETRIGHQVRRTFMFTDIVDSTRLVAGMGDERWAAVLRSHDRTVRELLVHHGGTEVKQRGGGDGFFAVFDDPSSAVECAIAIQRGFAGQRETTGFAPEIRIGLHEADALLSGGDFAGLGVHEAARIAGVAEGGDILTSEATAVAANARATTPVRRVEMKGLRDPMAILSIEWGGDSA